MNVFSLCGTDLFVASTVHLTMPPPPAPVPVPVPHVEGGRLAAAPTFAKLSPNVRLQGAAAVKLGHDVGFMIPHLGPLTPLLATHIAFSGCKALFGKSRVLVNGTPAAWFLPIAAGLQVCADPFPLPIGLVPTALTTTVKFGFAWDDLVLGHVDVVVDQLLSQVLRAARELGATPAIKSPYQRFVDRLAAKLAGSTTADRIGRAGAPIVQSILAEHYARLVAGIASSLDKGVRTHAKKAISPLVPKARELADALGVPPPEAFDLGPMFTDGMLDQVPFLEGAP